MIGKNWEVHLRRIALPDQSQGKSRGGGLLDVNEDHIMDYA